MKSALAVLFTAVVTAGCTLDIEVPCKVTGLLVQRDDRILVSTECGHFDGKSVGPVFRLHPDGRLDLGFDTHHLAMRDFNGSARIQSMLEDGDGRILMAIEQLPPGESDWLFRIIRLLGDGNPDEAFNSRAAETLEEFPRAPRWARLALLRDGGYLLAFETSHLLWLGEDGGLLQQTPLSILATDGVLALGEPRFFAALSDGRFVAAGPPHRNHYPHPWSLFVFRTDHTGDYVVDLATGPLRENRRRYRGPLLANITAVLPEPSGDFIIANLESILRLRSDGTRDPEFQFDPTYLQTATPRGIVGLQDGRIILGTHASSYQDTAGTLPGLVALRPNGEVDKEFMRNVGFGPRPVGNRLFLAVQSDDAIVVAGEFNRCGTRPAHSLIRLNAEGKLDESFLGQLGLEW